MDTKLDFYSEPCPSFAQNSPCSGKTERAKLTRLARRPEKPWNIAVAFYESANNCRLSRKNLRDLATLLRKTSLLHSLYYNTGVNAGQHTATIQCEYVWAVIQYFRELENYVPPKEIRLRQKNLSKLEKDTLFRILMFIRLIRAHFLQIHSWLLPIGWNWIRKIHLREEKWVVGLVFATFEGLVRELDEVVSSSRWRILISRSEDNHSE